MVNELANPECRASSLVAAIPIEDIRTGFHVTMYGQPHRY
jgi:hypothetical protein